ncbi:MAG: PDZ domain-containing protein, partial [Gemmatimonas sp.]
MRYLSYRAVLAAAVLSLPGTTYLGAQTGSRADENREVEARIERLPGAMTISLGSPNRAVLGVTLAASSKSDTEGVRVDEVQPDGPAAKAGLKAGDVITAINGVSLRVSADDAEDPALQGIAGRRLTRTLAKAKAGDNVDLRVRSGGAERSVSVKTVSASELNSSARNKVIARQNSSDASVNENRGVIGMSIGGTGNARDTIGLFINSVVTDGPADKAGVVEGERIASVNGVDVRVPREDLEDASAMSARANRFIREVQKVAPGGNVTLRMYSGGRYREVTVKTVRSSDLPKQGFHISIGDGGMVFSMPGRVFFDGNRLEIDREAVERALESMRLKIQDIRELRLENIPGSSGARGNGGTILRAAPRRIIT